MDLVIADTSKYEKKSDEISDYITTNFSWSKATDKIKTILSLGD